MEMKTVFELKTLTKERGLYGYSRLTKRELVELLQLLKKVKEQSIQNCLDVICKKNVVGVSSVLQLVIPN